MDLKPKGQDHKREGSEEEGKNGSADSNGELNAEHKKELATKKKKAEEIRADDVQRLFRTRDNRKGRHALLVFPSADQNAKYLSPPSTSTIRATLLGILRMFTTYPIWDVSYLVAVIFTWGSVVWVINSFFVWLPLQLPSSEFPGEIANAGGITAFIGATIFELGSMLLMLEAVNEERADCFGWAVEEVWEEGAKLIRVKTDEEGCRHHHRNKKNLVGKGRAATAEKEHEQEPTSRDKRNWTWCPTWYELRTHYFKEVGFLACFAQMIGATIFWISGFTALPPIYSRLTSTAAQNGAYWLPQVIGGTGFIVSGTLFMLETQQKWYLPAWKVLGWHIGAWNLVGGIGFTLCGALGFAAANSGAVYQGSLATFWGSWCFLVGSAIQWYESLDKHPVDVEEGGGRVGDTKPVT